MVTVHYTGTLQDGTVFDASRMHGGPVSFPLNGVIKGWTEGVGSISRVTTGLGSFGVSFLRKGKDRVELLAPNTTPTLRRSTPIIRSERQ
jgi:hypothetical protein